MPLDHRDSYDAFLTNLKELMASGRSRAQALAIALKTRREAQKKARSR